MDPITIGALAIGAYLIFGRKAKKKAPFTPGTGDLPTDIPTDGPDVPDAPKPGSDTPPGPGEPSKIPSNVIGGGWDWDEKNIWPTEGSIAGALVGISKGRYAPGSNFAMPNYHITDASGQGAVRAFQRDWNDFVAKPPETKTDHWALQLPHPTPTKPVGKLTVDGFIGKNTWKAMRWVFKRSKQLQGIPGANKILDWEKIVQGSRALG